MAKTRRERDRKRISARDRAAKRQTGFVSKCIKLPEGIGFFGIEKAGVKSVNVIPFVTGQGNPFCDPGEVYYERTFYVHRGVGGSGGNGGDSYICPKKTAGKRCPICEHRTQLTKQEDADEEVIKNLAPKERQLWIVQDRANLDKGLQIWDISYHLFGKALDARIKNSDEEDGYDFFYDLEDGLLLKLGMEEKTWSGNTFYECVSIDFKPRREALDPDLIDEAPCLDDMLIIPSYDALKAAYLQTEDEDDEEEDAPPPRKRKLPVDEVDDEDDEDDEEADDVDEEEVPAKPAKSKPAAAKPAKKPPVDDDDDDEEEEEKLVEVGDDDDECVACDGAGKNSKGGKCAPCHGTGHNKPKPKPAKAAPPKAKAKPVAEDEEEDGEWEEEVAAYESNGKAKAATKPAKAEKPAKAKPTKPAKVEESEEDDDDWDEGWDD